MADYTFFFHPHSRAQIVRWALREVNADYDAVLVDWDNRPSELLKANPMGKLPTIIHHARGDNRVVTETAAICHYLADSEKSDLLPREEEKAAYFRWLFFAAGPCEAAVTTRNLGLEPDAQQQHTVGFGSFDQVVAMLDKWLIENDYVCGNRFTMADVYVGAQMQWALMFNNLPQRDSFVAYVARLRERDAYKEAQTIDLQMFESNPRRAKELV